MKKLLVLSAMTFFVAGLNRVEAALVLESALAHSLGTVSSTENIRLDAILSNSLTSSENLVIDETGRYVSGGTYDGYSISWNIGRTFPGETLDIYDYDFGPKLGWDPIDNSFTRISNLVLAPGELYSYTHGFFIAPTGGAPVGEYSGPFGFFLFQDADALHADSEYSFVVTSPVPIPATIWFFGSGLIGLIGIRKSSRGRSWKLGKRGKAGSEQNGTYLSDNRLT